MKRLQSKKSVQKVHIKYIDAQWIMKKEEQKLNMQTQFCLQSQQLKQKGKFNDLMSLSNQYI